MDVRSMVRLGAALMLFACSAQHGAERHDGGALDDGGAELDEAAAQADPDSSPVGDGDAGAEEGALPDPAGPHEPDATPEQDAAPADAELDASAHDALVPDLDAESEAQVTDAAPPVDGEPDAAEPPDCNPSAGALLVASGSTIVEITLSGQSVRSLVVPAGGRAGDVDGELRDLVQDRCGDLFAYQGTFVPSVAMQRDGGWDHAWLPGFSTVNNISYGGIALAGAHVFATDMFTYGGEAGGVLRFPCDGGEGERFALGDATDLNVGQDGLLYVLLGESLLKQIDPESMRELRSITLQRAVRGVAVDGAGRIYGASWDGSVYAFQPDGSMLGALALQAGSLCDIDLNQRGLLAVSARSGDVLLTSVELSGWSSLKPIIPDSSKVFVAFTNSGQRAEPPLWTMPPQAGGPR